MGAEYSAWNVPLSFAKVYKYLGNLLDCGLTLNINFDRAYKRASGQLWLLQSASFLTVEVTSKIFKTMILPLLPNSSTTKLTFFEKDWRDYTD